MRQISFFTMLFLKKLIKLNNFDNIMNQNPEEFEKYLKDLREIKIS